ncbi:erythromycin esterase family protein [Desertivirga arenae]|uniref:erythromycin esterase family protein n=1 Tax=Desertivirga arenae TaxID=2810309 RepID=UPI001A973DB9|nr:erythromycin esterase family protein [Pedobacter sp. SYSU D00823]
MAAKSYASSRALKLDRKNTFKLESSKDLGPLLERVGEAHYVLLGEATHGTHEYYTWRTAISKRLIKEKGFNFIAVEGDWPDCYKLNRYVKGYEHQDKTAHELLEEFDRWPTWMWANWEIVSLINWLKEYNLSQPVDKKVGFYGLDVYSLWESMDVLMDYLSLNDPKAAEYAADAIRCFEPYQEDEHRYARAQKFMDDSCQEHVINLLSEVRRKASNYSQDPEAALNARQNAEVAVNAEMYYRNMTGFDVNTWNLRDTHMVETLNRLIQFHGTGAKAIVWEHNTHIGDARYTDMVQTGDINVGQLLREQKGEDDTVLVGFGSYHGTVIAGDSWGAPMRKMIVPDARPGSIEDLLHREFLENQLLIFDKNNRNELFSKMVAHRAIGVVYNPDHERYGNYVPTILNRRYDAFIYIDETKALNPLHIRIDGHKIPETYPFEY